VRIRMEDCSKPDSGKVLGIWKLVSLEIEVQGTGQMEPPMGDNPTGYAVFTQEGRAFFILSPESCVSPQRTMNNALGC
jgi:hypothetical protein